MTKGQVKWFDPKKGYGFIVGPEGQDVFIHYSQIKVEGFKTLGDNQWVDYELVESDKGWQARQVAPVVDAPRDEPSEAPTQEAAPAEESEGGGYEGTTSSGYEGAQDH